MTTAVRTFEVRPEWVTPFPWLPRLREMSPVAERVSYLWPRFRADYDEWWLYEVTPAQMLTSDRVQQLTVHWSDLPTAEQQGRKTFVTEYQHYMFRTHRVEARPFWVLQGSKYVIGGTPYAYTERERKLLEAENEPDEPIPPGTLPNIPFDERVVQAIQARDRLLKVGGSLDALQKASTPDALKREDDETEKLFRKAFLSWQRTTNHASSEFMKWYLRRPEAEGTLPKAPKHLANAVTSFRDKYLDTGVIDYAGQASSRLLVPVN